jgi:hypothetical protein
MHTSPDQEDRIKDFLTRHSGPGKETRSGESQAGLKGWSEVYAADGYTLRCDWTTYGGAVEMAFSEIAPGNSR